MKRLCLLAVAAVIAACTPADSPTYVAQQWQHCRANQLPLERIGACSAVIASPAATPEQRASALLERGRQRGQLGQDARAVADFGRALRINGALAEAYLERGLVHQNRGAFYSAILDYDQALALQPELELAAARRNEAVASLSQSPPTELEQITQALAWQPESAELWNSRCWVRAVSGEELDTALADCNEALRLAPRYAPALDSRGLVYLKRGELQAALADYNAALTLEPTNAHYRYGRGIVRIRMGDVEAGQSDLKLAEETEYGIALRYEDYGVTP